MDIYVVKAVDYGVCELLYVGVLKTVGMSIAIPYVNTNKSEHVTVSTWIGGKCMLEEVVNFDGSLRPEVA